MILQRTKRSTALFRRVRSILESARAGAARSVNTAQVVANWLIGREIVEEEQKGKAKAKYGARLLQDLSSCLKAEYGNGYSVDNLELFRRFYTEYPGLISEAVRRKFGRKPISEAVRRKLPSDMAMSVSSVTLHVPDKALWSPGCLSSKHPGERTPQADFHKSLQAAFADGSGTQDGASA